jgi:hypothetical protein
MLGQLVYIDDTGAVVGFANVFESNTNPSMVGALRGLSDLGPVPPMVEETFTESVLMTTYGIEAHSMDKSKFERESLAQNSSNLIAMQYWKTAFLLGNHQPHHCSVIT